MRTLHLPPTRGVIPALTVSAAFGLLAVPAASVAATSRGADVAQTSSENWSGYVVGASSHESTSGDTFKSVTGSWVQPAAKCTAQDSGTYAAFWVGLGGSGASSAEGQTGKLEQAGTEADCTTRGTASYHAWYELVPSAPVTVNLAVHPGDHLTTTTTVVGDEVTNTIADHTTGHSVSKTVRMADPDTSSAEWIAEAPSRCTAGASDCTPLPLTDFGTVRFTDASATSTAGHTGGIDDADWTPVAVTLSPSSDAFGGSGGDDNGYGGYAGYGYGGGQAAQGSSSAGASPSALSSAGSAFSVAYAAGSASAEPTTTAGGGYGDGYGDGGAGGYGDGGAGGYGGAGGDGYGWGEGGETVVVIPYGV